MNYSAIYIKSALQVNPYNYSRYRGKSINNEEDYNDAILKKCIEQKISVVGLADHGCVDSSESLRTKLVEGEIVVFPGFEIATAEKIHIVCLFPPDTSISKLNQFLGTLGLGHAKNGNESSTLTCLDIADKVDQLGGFWYAAHITSDNGILKIGGLNKIWKDDHLIAAQIPDSRDNVDPNYKNIIKNSDPNYHRMRMPALINACDIASPDDLDKNTAVTLIKMTNPSFDNFVMAFKDPDSRIKLSSELENSYQSCLKSVSISGGYLDGFVVEFSDNLTTIIGGRGTGKSTLISLIRYALDLPIEHEEQKAFKGLIDTNLGSSGKIELKIISNAQYGQTFNITRRYNQQPVIKDTQGNVSNLCIADILPTIEIYGQNEIISVVSDPDKINKAVQRLLPTDQELDMKMKKAYVDLTDNGNKLSKIEEEIETYSEKTGDLPSLQERLKFYNDAGLGEKLPAITKLATEEGQFDAFSQKIPDESLNISELKVEALENDELKLLMEAAKKYNTAIQRINIDYKNAVNELKMAFELYKGNWEISKVKYDEEVKNSLKQLGDIQDKSSTEIVNDYSMLLKKVASAEPTQVKMKDAEIQKQNLFQERKNLIENYRKCCDDSDQKIIKLLKKINSKKLNGKLRLSVKFRQNKKSLIKKLKEIQGIGDNGIVGISQYADFDIFTFVEDIRSGVDVLKTKYSITSNVAQKIVSNFTGKRLRDLENLQLKDLIQIELEVNGVYKKIENLSKGQQCTAILNILLLDNKDPLIVDQPEDNLDNAFIANNLVETIRDNKIKRQYIFATHNANIPVFGDAELIIAMEELEGSGLISDNSIGSIDSSGVRKQVIEILEGGPEAFKMREKKYGI